MGTGTRETKKTIRKRDREYSIGTLETRMMESIRIICMKEREFTIGVKDISLKGFGKEESNKGREFIRETMGLVSVENGWMGRRKIK
jgi:hypothetical protein